LCYTVFIVGYGSIGAPSFSMLSRYGRFWYFFPQQAVALNDIAAYAFGKMFGRTKLINVSPNKTVEGFLGGMICNVITTWFFSGYFLQTADKDFWICGT
jgi:CDP-diglyceride synthetase